jgi:hypothetical protein
MVVLNWRRACPLGDDPAPTGTILDPPMRVDVYGNT